MGVWYSQKKRRFGYFLLSKLLQFHLIPCFINVTWKFLGEVQVPKMYQNSSKTEPRLKSLNFSCYLPIFKICPKTTLWKCSIYLNVVQWFWFLQTLGNSLRRNFCNIFLIDLNEICRYEKTIHQCLYWQFYAQGNLQDVFKSYFATKSTKVILSSLCRTYELLEH